MGMLYSLEFICPNKRYLYIHNYLYQLMLRWNLNQCYKLGSPNLQSSNKSLGHTNHLFLEELDTQLASNMYKLEFFYSNKSLRDKHKYYQQMKAQLNKDPLNISNKVL